jgi:hypothetical protein
VRHGSYCYDSYYDYNDGYDMISLPIVRTYRPPSCGII